MSSLGAMHAADQSLTNTHISMHVHTYTHTAIFFLSVSCFPWTDTHGLYRICFLSNPNSAALKHETVISGMNVS